MGIGNLHTLPFEDIIKGLKSYKESLDSREQFYRKRLEVMEESDWPHHIRGLVTRPLAMMDAERKWIQSYINDLEAHHEAKEELHGS